ncbi:MAG: plasmid pRiA4b ORF-3 family protein, partial [Thermosynechococcaceae cyanobacterium]
DRHFSLILTLFHTFVFLPKPTYFTLENPKAIYTYDFGDEWLHIITLEMISPVVPNVKYPCCIRGERKCPPEDVGGVEGYYEFLTIMGNPRHEEHKEMQTWFGGKYDPGEFDPEKVKFTDPAKRLKNLLR